ncbi:hypothetical protein GCM10007242_44460 [Pigmentiphaga litoralis]|uniref:hypothetical protein n=1 Tax=Pigmentiphaga litoralis TaxID=516702 RepID=UPI00167A2FC7|nr:hypothetical protein [Pigmentiphaga litoralis]GGX32635.1 hypothetical protein GCM10007242_44460 [Pigmentiphaga litoralis]
MSDIFASRLAIAIEAEQAAIRFHWAREPGDVVPANPYPEGSDAHDVWKAHFDRELASHRDGTPESATC